MTILILCFKIKTKVAVIDSHNDCKFSAVGSHTDCKEWQLVVSVTTNYRTVCSHTDLIFKSPIIQHRIISIIYVATAHYQLVQAVPMT